MKTRIFLLLILTVGLSSCVYNYNKPTLPEPSEKVMERWQQEITSTSNLMNTILNANQYVKTNDSIAFRLLCQANDMLIYSTSKPIQSINTAGEQWTIYKSTYSYYYSGYDHNYEIITITAITDSIWNIVRAEQEPLLGGYDVKGHSYDLTVNLRNDYFNVNGKGKTWLEGRFFINSSLHDVKWTMQSSNLTDGEISLTVFDTQTEPYDSIHYDYYFENNQYVCKDK